MSKLQGDDAPTYVLNYPRWVRVSRTITVILLVGITLVRWVLTWVDFLRSPLEVMSNTAWGTPEGSRFLIDTLAGQAIRPLIAANLSLLLVAGALAFLYTILPDLALADDGVAVHTLTGWNVIPWTKVEVVRIMEMEESDRYLVLVQGTWSRWSPWPRLVSLCMGAGFVPGLFLTSDLRDFEPLMLRLHREVKQAVPEALFDDKFVSPSALMVMEPTSALKSLVTQARDEGWPMSISAQAMGAVAGGLILVQLLLMLLVGDYWWEPVAIIGLCSMEWLIGTFYLYALAEFFPGPIQFEEAALLYPLPQIPRALMAVPMAMLVAAGAPFFAALLGLVGVLWAVVLTAMMVQQLYHLESILPAVIGGVFQALFQFLILAVVFA